MRVFFENVACERCGAALGFVPGEMAMAAFEIAADGAWTRLRDGAAPQRPCSNYNNAQTCNWMLPAGDAAPFCVSCRTTDVLPALGKPENRVSWALIEQAKRRMVYSLLSLRLPVRSKAEDAAHGLSFRFLEELTPAQRVMTGHDNGTITLNIDEADDARREEERTRLHEPYRTLIGHFRHEIGHYYWDLLVQPTQSIDDFRALFGDERADYAAALQTHYEQGPPPDWADRFVSSYASTHPWEDWAETWAHYLHMADTADTAMSFGVDATNVELTSDLFTPADLWQPDDPDAGKFLDFINGWVLLTNVLNELSRSMGQPDYYPFVLPRAAVGKLQFIHRVVTQQRPGDAPSMVVAADVAESAPEPAQAEAPQQAPGQS